MSDRAAAKHHSDARRPCLELHSDALQLDLRPDAEMRIPRDHVERCLDLLYPWKSHYLVVVRLGPFHKRTTTHGGDGEMGPSTIALVLKDDEYVEVGIELPLKDLGGNPLLNPDGTPYQPDIVLATSDPAIAPVEQVPGNAGKIYGQQLGQASVTLTVPFPDGSIQTVEILTTAIPSAAAPIQVTISEPQKGEPAPV
jgi:hypothetical protein